LTALSATSTRPLFAGFGIVAAGILVALVTDLALEVLTPAKLAFALGGFVLLIPTIVLKDPKAYWLFMLVLSIPFDITKSLSIGMVDSQALVDEFGEPMSGTLGLEIYVTDIVLVAMLLPWLARICLRRTTLYFPALAYLFVFYLAWALLVSLANAQSIILSLFELFRECLYFLFFVYLINNVSTPLHFRNAVRAMFLGLIIGAGTVIVFFALGLGTDTIAFANLHDAPATSAQSQFHNMGKEKTGPHALTLKDESVVHLGSSGQGQTKRSQGIFGHPGIAAALCCLILPIVLAYLMTAQNTRERILFTLVYVWGCVAVLLTFSRAGFIGLIASTLVFLAVAGRAGLIPRKIARRSGVAATLLVALSVPVLLVYLQTRPESLSMRFNIYGAVIHGYLQHPILGVGLNNSTAAMKEGREELRESGIRAPLYEPADSYYLAIITEIGPVGSILFFGFFGGIVMIAVRLSREVAVENKPLLVGMIAGLGALATQSIADGPLAGHAVSSLLWLFAALIIAMRRYTPTKAGPSIAGSVNPALVGA
jgi:putative inorganic carbon (HCO3(-)) transporter